MGQWQLTDRQKDEIRRLTQLANRRIRSATKQYEAEGQEIVPREVAGHIQTRDKWHSDKNPLSRSVKFESKEAYKERLEFLRSFDPKSKSRQEQKKTITEYKKIQQEKTLSAVETSLGVDVPAEMEKEISKMSAPELRDFWEKFSENASRKGLQYSSEAVMQETMQEFFPSEDLQNIGV